MQLERLCQRQRWACGVVVIVRRHVFEATCANGCLFGHVPLRFWEWYMCHKKKTICTRLITWLTRLTKNVCVFLGWRNYSSYPLNSTTMAENHGGKYVSHWSAAGHHSMRPHTWTEAIMDGDHYIFNAYNQMARVQPTNGLYIHVEWEWENRLLLKWSVMNIPVDK